MDKLIAHISFPPSVSLRQNNYGNLVGKEVEATLACDERDAVTDAHLTEIADHFRALGASSVSVSVKKYPPGVLIPNLANLK